MLSSILNFKKAITIKISIIRAFVIFVQFALYYDELKSKRPLPSPRRGRRNQNRKMLWILEKESSLKN